MIVVILTMYFTKANIISEVASLIANLILAEGVYVSIFAIARIPIGELFVVGALAIYILVMSCGFKIKLLEKQEKKKK